MNDYAYVHWEGGMAGGGGEGGGGGGGGGGGSRGYMKGGMYLN